MSPQERLIFFELLQSALWEREPELSVFHGQWSWCSLLQVYQNHSLLGVVAPIILSLPSNLLPEPHLQQFILSVSANLMQQHQQLNQMIGEEFAKLSAAGCTPILLKGQGLTTLYPSSCLRSCGDIDVYVGPTQMDIAKLIINAQATQEAISEAEVEEVEHHYHIDINGFSIEVHRYPGLAGNLLYRKEYQRLSAQYLTPDRSEKATLPTPQGTITISVPPADFNVWYVFNHLVQHYREEGVGLRQFCDWLMILKHNSSFLTPHSSLYYSQLSTLNSQLTQVGLLRSWQILGGILVHQLGFPSSTFPFYDERMANKSQGYILDEILNGNNFRFSSLDDTFKEQTHGFKRTLLALKYFYKCSRPLSVISRTYPFTAFLRFLTFGFKGLKQRHFSQCDPK